MLFSWEELNSEIENESIEFRTVDKDSEICINGGVGTYEMVPDDFENMKEFE